ncbi:MAG TPA: transglutaminase domain-containing protein, partial [Pyrinomonadaceae bacterium]|nr:transglutaminase domain-containing protein [Pyrinomonadaceae bacterium]
TTYTWELRNLPPIEPEPASPSAANLVPRLAVNYGPEGAASTPGSGRVFNSWADVSKWTTELHDPRIEPDDRIALKVRELTANAKTELEKIQSVARYAQNIQYISVQVGIGGYQPHAATEVFSKSYGDCKDKVTLMRSMLRALRMQSYPVLVYAGDPTFVREEWPAAGQFNHVIVAVKVSDETNAPTVMQHPTLGRLLFFDPTDPHVPVGDLPHHEQGSLGLVAAGDGGALLRLPVTPPEANRAERSAELELGPDGQLKAVFKERSTGEAAAFERGLFRELPRPEYRKVIEQWIGSGATGAQITKVEPADAASEGRFALDVEFTAPKYAQVMQGRLIVFKPAVISHHERLFLTEEKRKHPIVLSSSAFSETVRVKLPEGFEVDEVPEPTKLDTPFGSYTADYEIKDGHLLFKRAFTQRAVTLPAEQYKTVRDFYTRIRAAEQAPVVLAKK